MKQLIYWTWCLPQTLLGFIVKALCKAKPTQFKKFLSFILGVHVEESA